jgi:hypothetical protein
MDVDTRAQQDLRYRGARFNEKGCLQVRGGGDALGAINLPSISWSSFTAVLPLDGAIPKMQAYPQLIPREQALISGMPPPRELPYTKSPLTKCVRVCTSLVYVNDFRIYNPCNVNVKPCKSILCCVKQCMCKTKYIYMILCGHIK